MGSLYVALIVPYRIAFKASGLTFLILWGVKSVVCFGLVWLGLQYDGLMHGRQALSAERSPLSYSCSPRLYVLNDHLGNNPEQVEGKANLMELLPGQGLQ